MFQMSLVCCQIQRLRLQALLEQMRKEDPKEWCTTDGVINQHWLDQVYTLPRNNEEWTWLPQENCIGTWTKSVEHNSDLTWNKQKAKQFAHHAAWDPGQRWEGEYCKGVDMAAEDACSCSLQFLCMATVRYGKNGKPLLWDLMPPVFVLEEVDVYNNHDEEEIQRMTYPVVLWWLKSQWNLSCQLEKENDIQRDDRWEKQVHGIPLENLFAVLFSGEVGESGTAFSDNYTKPGVYTMPYKKRNLSQCYSCPHLRSNGRAYSHMVGLMCDRHECVSTGTGKNEVVYNQRGCHLNHVRIEVRGYEQMVFTDQFTMGQWLPLLETNPRGSKGFAPDAMKQNQMDWQVLYRNNTTIQFNGKLFTVGGAPFPCLYPSCAWPAAEHVDPTTGLDRLPEVTCSASHKTLCSMYGFTAMRQKQQERRAAADLAEQELRTSAGVVNQPGADPGASSSSSDTMNPAAMAASWGCAVVREGVWAEEEDETRGYVMVDLGSWRPPPPPPTEYSSDVGWMCKWVAGGNVFLLVWRE
jgi:hypothetical protein